MKLVLAIVNSDDSADVMRALTKEGIQVTKLATTGGFLMAGNTTFMIGTEEEKVDGILEIIRKYSHKRTQAMPANRAPSGPPGPPRRPWRTRAWPPPPASLQPPAGEEGARL